MPSLTSHGTLSRAIEQRWGLRGRAYTGQLASVLELQGHGLVTLQLEAGSDSFLMLLQCQGLLEGSCGGRPLSSRRDGILGGLAPQERLVLTSKSPFNQQLWLHLPYRLLAETFEKTGRPMLTDLLIHQWPEGTGLALRPLLESLLATANKTTDASPSSQWWMHRIEASIFASLMQLVAMEDMPPEVEPVQPLIPELHDQALEFMRDHINEPIDLGAIARACSCSPRTLQIAFRVHLQKTPIQVLRSMRLEAMRQALLRGTTVTDASQQAGLAISGKLSGLYREAFGETPRQTSQNGRMNRLSAESLGDPPGS